MRLEDVELRLVDLALRRPVGTAAGTHGHRPVAYVRVRAGGVEGWGECAALPGGTLVDPPLEEVWRTLATVAVPALLRAARARGGEAPPALLVPRLLDRSPAGRLAGAALEMALLDAELRAAGLSFAGYLAGAGRPDAASVGAAGGRRAGPRMAGAGRAGPGGVGAGAAGPAGPEVAGAAPDRSVPAGTVVGIPDDRRPDSVVRAVAAAVEQGYGRVRVKIEPGWDAVPLRAVRRAFPDLVLQADANGSYRLGPGDGGRRRAPAGERSAARLDELDELGLACIEQPLPPGGGRGPLSDGRRGRMAGEPGDQLPGEPHDGLPGEGDGDLAAHAALADRLATPVGLDESLTTPDRVRAALRAGACEVACLKPARLGGVAATSRALRACRSAGVPAFVGGFFETGLGRSANAALATLPGFTLAGDLSDPAGYLEHDPSPYRPPQAGWVRPPDGPGVGPPPDPGWLARRTVATETFGGVA